MKKAVFLASLTVVSFSILGMNNNTSPENKQQNTLSQQVDSQLIDPSLLAGVSFYGQQNTLSDQNFSFNILKWAHQQITQRDQQIIQYLQEINRLNQSIHQKDLMLKDQSNNIQDQSDNSPNQFIRSSSTIDDNSTLVETLSNEKDEQVSKKNSNNEHSVERFLQTSSNLESEQTEDYNELTIKPNKKSRNRNC